MALKIEETCVFTIVEVKERQDNGDTFSLHNLELSKVRVTKDGYEVDFLRNGTLHGTVSGGAEVRLNLTRTGKKI